MAKMAIGDREMLDRELGQRQTSDGFTPSPILSQACSPMTPSEKQRHFCSLTPRLPQLLFLLSLFSVLLASPNHRQRPPPAAIRSACQFHLFVFNILCFSQSFLQEESQVVIVAGPRR